MPSMANKKKSADRHRSHHMLRLPEPVHRRMKELATRNRRPLTWEVTNLLIEELKRQGLWTAEDEAALST